MVCAGLAFAALDGVGAANALGLRLWVILLPVAGALMIHLPPPSPGAAGSR